MKSLSFFLSHLLTCLAFAVAPGESIVVPVATPVYDRPPIVGVVSSYGAIVANLDPKTEVAIAEVKQLQHLFTTTTWVRISKPVTGWIKAP